MTTEIEELTPENVKKLFKQFVCHIKEQNLMVDYIIHPDLRKKINEFLESEE